MIKGRPTKFTKQIAQEILERLAEGETLLAICRDHHLPTRSSVSRWTKERPDLNDEIARAREEGRYALIEEARDIVDASENDWIQKQGRDGQPAGFVLNGESIRRSKLRADQRWREAEALAREVAGKRQVVDRAGGVEITAVDDGQLMDEIMELLATGRVKLRDGMQIEKGDDDEDDNFSDIA